jgi:hypothetical protein
MRENQFYCVACAKKVTIKNPDDICFKNLRNKKRKGGVPALVGYCSKCDCDLYKFVPVDDKQYYKEKYGTC